MHKWLSGDRHFTFYWLFKSDGLASSHPQDIYNGERAHPHLELWDINSLKYVKVLWNNLQKLQKRENEENEK